MILSGQKLSISRFSFIFVIIFAFLPEIASNCSETPRLPNCSIRENGGRSRRGPNPSSGNRGNAGSRADFPEPPNNRKLIGRNGGSPQKRTDFTGSDPLSEESRQNLRRVEVNFRERPAGNTGRGNQGQNPNRQNRFPAGLNAKTGEKCKYPDLWLIPGKTDETCKRPGRPNVMNINTNNVIIEPKILRLPGCFTIEIEVETLETPPGMPKSFFGKAEYQWWNFPDFQELKCQNSSANGCGGYGNNCFYCDICSSLRDLNSSRVISLELQLSKHQQSFAKQFRGIQCPDRPSKMRLVRKFCFNDWNVFDADGDCKFDFLPEDYKSAIKTIGQIGYGTMIAKFKLSHNATGPQLQKKETKEAEIEKVVRKELEHREANWDTRRGKFETFRNWYIQYRKDNWHRKKYLPWLIYTNEIACLKLTFDVCDKPPTGGQDPNSRGRINSNQWQCE